ncbi:hypothetical protein SAMN04489727_1704 [Amycolatopsis tolypomycina]|uniref:Uncharacterized protein n=1 Tax=Amycolatopsis tolypomycina TaxID=208445 RepID=A0A1H4JAI5_9PSEU|nr:hypothetical protein [Amycolatopsis tolypomycina]SEB43339.1 hypothetical protein SAMN04489727_1704 [Amycolatopsis tolypomycina]
MNEKLAVLIPPEPPELSVFLDRARRAWQRIGPGWYMAGAVRPLLGPGSSSVRWGQLLLDFGEGEVIWQPTRQQVAERATEETAAAEQPPLAASAFLGTTRHGHPIGSETVPPGHPVPNVKRGR